MVQMSEFGAPTGRQKRIEDLTDPQAVIPAEEEEDENSLLTSLLGGLGAPSVFKSLGLSNPMGMLGLIPALIGQTMDDKKGVNFGEAADSTLKTISPLAGLLGGRK